MNKIIPRSKIAKTVGVFALISAVLLLVFFYFRNSQPPRNTVYITKNGFVPAGIKINVGEKIKFVSKTGEAFWPASDPHPAHTILNTFDSRKAVAPPDFFEFQFTQVGLFRYHDHLNPNYRGVINVVEPKSEGQLTHEYCKKLTNIYEKENCFLNIIENLQNTSGDVSALELANDIVKDNPDLVEECHNMAHFLGEYAYWNYSKTKKLVKSDLISFCGFGYVHGFMQEFSHHSPEFVNKSKSFCDYFAYKVKYNSNDWDIAPGDTCYNGIGHGIVLLYFSDFENDLVSLVERSTEECGSINSEESALDHCYQGVFSGISGLYLGTHGFKIPLDEKDPFWLCSKLNNDFNMRCFANMVPAVGVIYKRDVSKLLYSIKAKNIDNYNYAVFLAGDIAAEWFRLKEVKSKDVLSACSGVSTKSRYFCFKGFVDGLAREEVTKENQNIVHSFCRSVFLNQKEQRDCMVSYLNEINSGETGYLERIILDLEKSDYELICSDPNMKENCK